MRHDAGTFGPSYSRFDMLSSLRSTPRKALLLSLRLVLVLLVIGNNAHVLSQDSATPPSAEHVFVSMDVIYSAGRVADRPDLHDLLRELDLLPDHDQPIVLRIKSFDSVFWFELEDTQERMIIDVLTTRVAALDAPSPILVVAPRGTVAGRQQRGSYMPSNVEELLELGFDWLVHRGGLDIRWDTEGRIADLVGQPRRISGVDDVLPLNMTICVDSQRVLGWAVPMRYREPVDAGLGQFVEDCTKGVIELQTESSLAPELLERNGLSGSYFAIALPFYGFDGAVESIATARQLLGAATPQISLYVVATDALDVDRTRAISAAEHAGLLEEMGIEVARELTAQVPAWVNDRMVNPRISLLLFDDQGQLIEGYSHLSFDPGNQETLQQTLLRLGLF